MSNKIGFITAVKFDTNTFEKKTIGQKAVENFDDYFFLKGKKAQVIKQNGSNNGFYIVRPEKQTSNIPLNILKIISYGTIAIPLIMLIGKAIARACFHNSIEKKIVSEFPKKTRKAEEAEEAKKALETKEAEEAARKFVEAGNKADSVASAVKPTGQGSEPPSSLLLPPSLTLPPKRPEDEDSDISSLPGGASDEGVEDADSSESAESTSSSSEPESVDADEMGAMKLQQKQNLPMLYQTVQKFKAESKKRGYHKLVLNEHGEFVVKGTKSRSAKDDKEIMVFKTILNSINMAMNLGVDNFQVTEKEVSIFELMDNLFSSELAKRVIGKFFVGGEFDEKSELAAFIHSNLGFIKDFSPQLYDKLNIFQAKKKKTKKRRSFKIPTITSGAKRNLQKSIEQILDFAPVPVRIKMISEKIDLLESPTISGKVDSKLAIKLPPPPRNHPFNEFIQTEKTFCEQIKWFSEKKKWPKLSGKMDFFEALEKVEAITDKERILFAKGWEDVQTSSEAVIIAYPDFSKGSHAENMEQLLELLSSKEFQSHLSNLTNLIAKYNEMRNRLKDFGKDEKEKKLNKILDHLRVNNDGNVFLAVLINPVQRICRYPMLFNEMLKLIPDGDVKNQLQTNCEYVKKVLKIVNPMMPKG